MTLRLKELEILMKPLLVPFYSKVHPPFVIGLYSSQAQVPEMVRVNVPGAPTLTPLHKSEATVQV